MLDDKLAPKVRQLEKENNLLQAKIERLERIVAMLVADSSDQTLKEFAEIKTREEEFKDYIASLANKKVLDK